MRHYTRNIIYNKKCKLEALAFAAKGLELNSRSKLTANFTYDPSPPGLQPERIATDGFSFPRFLKNLSFSKQFFPSDFHAQVSINSF